MSSKMELSKEKKVHVNDLIDYVICPAKMEIGRVTEKASSRVTARKRMKLGINDFLLYLMIRKENWSDNITTSVFSDLEYDGIESDIKKYKESLDNLALLIDDTELSLKGCMSEVEVSYGGIILNGSFDLTAESIKTGYRHPVIIDLSNTKYEPFYNPIMYRAQLVSDHFELEGTNTKVIVLGAASGKKWEYDHRKYGELLRSSIKETLVMIDNNLYPARFGWWCAGCDYRGICHNYVKK